MSNNNRKKRSNAKAAANSTKETEEEPTMTENESLKEESADQESEKQNEQEPPLLPGSNVKERIVIVLDRAEDEKSTMFTHENSEISPVQMLKMAVELFVQSKHSVNSKHEFALMTLNENNATWLVNFTSNLRVFTTSLKKVQPCTPEDIFNLDTIFELIQKHCDLPEHNKCEDVVREPEFIQRVILLYGRSYTIIECSRSEEMVAMLNSPFFIIDTLVTHESVDAANNCDKIFDSLQNLDTKEGSYFCPIGRDSTLLAEAIAKLVAHPLQRPLQKEEHVRDIEELCDLLK